MLREDVDGVSASEYSLCTKDVNGLLMASRSWPTVAASALRHVRCRRAVCAGKIDQSSTRPHVISRSTFAIHTCHSTDEGRGFEALLVMITPLSSISCWTYHMFTLDTGLSTAPSSLRRGGWTYQSGSSDDHLSTESLGFRARLMEAAGPIVHADIVLVKCHAQVCRADAWWVTVKLAAGTSSADPNAR